MTGTTPDQRWLAAVLPFIRAETPTAPARVLEIGCGHLGGFVPSLTVDGHDVVGVDPEAPEGSAYHRGQFELYDVRQPMDTVIACTSLHHVTDLDRALDRVSDILVPGGNIVVVEWARELFDEDTAGWCFDRLPLDQEEGWLQRHRLGWEASGEAWETYLASWADAEGLYAGDTILEAMSARFATRLLVRTPYLFSDLDDVSEATEQAAIDSDLIRATGIRYVGQRR
ncbi:MAG: class I SAM-dependent methyltransferase [Nocardioidaceae bacterium]